MRLLGLTLLGAALLAQAPQAPDNSKPDPTFRSTTSELILDFVVRDSRGRPVRDLTAEEVEIYEDGVKQTIRAFRSLGKNDITPESGPRVTQDGKTAVLDPLREINLVVFLYGGMQPLNRDYARRVGLEFLNSQLAPNTFVTVLSFDRSLQGLVNFTNDSAKLRAAIDRVTGGQTSTFSRDTAQIIATANAASVASLTTALRTDAQRSLNPQASGAMLSPGTLLGGVASTGLAANMPPNPDAAFVSAGTEFSASGDSALNAILLNILRREQRISQDTIGTALPLAIAHICEQLGRLPGRKTLIYMSEGLQVNAANPLPINHAIATANRNNVAIYSVDVNGLRLLSGWANRNIGMNTPAITGDEGIDRTNPEPIEDLKSHVQMNLAELSESTGGRLIANTNDLGKVIPAIAEDVRTRYEVSYSPTSTVYDGHFRKVEVRLKRRGLKVQSRSGYFALPLLPGQTVYPFEVALLKSLQTVKPGTGALAFTTSAMRLRGAANKQYLLGSEVPAASLKVVQDKAGPRVHASFLLLVRNEQGEIVEKLSRDLPIQVPADKLDELQRGVLQFAETLILAPGRYSIDSVLVDRNAEIASVKKQALIVPANPMVLSSPILIRRMDPVPAETAIASPLRFQGQRVTPSLSTALPSGTGELRVYLNCFSQDPSATLNIAVLHEGQAVGDAQMTLPSADQQGERPVLLQIPAAGWRAGLYELEATFREQGRVWRETLPIEIREGS